MSATDTAPTHFTFADFCAAYDLTGDKGRLHFAALEALGEGWSSRAVGHREERVLDHWSGFVRVTIDDGEFSVEESDRFRFEVGRTIFRGDRRVQGPRAIRFAQALAVELEVKA